MLRDNEDSVITLDGYAEGYLLKEGGIIKNWNRRYFMFRNGQLSYRKDSRESSRVVRQETITDAVYWQGAQFGLCVTLSTGRSLYLCAHSEEQASIWYEVFDDYLASLPEGGKDVNRKMRIESRTVLECERNDSTHCSACKGTKGGRCRYHL